MGINFNSTTTVIKVNSSATVNDQQPFTVSCWYFPRSKGASGYALIVGKIDSDGTPSTGRWLLQHNDDSGQGDTTFEFQKNCTVTSMQVTSQSGALTLNTWQHICLTWNGGLLTTDVQLFKNAVEVSYGGSTSGIGLANSDAASSLYFGNSGDTAINEDGITTEIAFYNKVLSLDEIRLLAMSRTKRMPLQVAPENLRGYWPMDEFGDGKVATGTNTIRDLSINNNHGTPLNSPLGRAEETLTY